MLQGTQAPGRAPGLAEPGRAAPGGGGGTPIARPPLGVGRGEFAPRVLTEGGGDHTWPGDLLGRPRPRPHRAAGEKVAGGGGSSPAAGERGPASGTHVSPFVTARVSGPGSSRGGRAPPVRARSRGSVRGPPRPGGSRRGKDGSRGRGDEPGPGAGSGAAAGSPGSSGQAPPRTARGPRVWLCAGRRKHSGPEHPFGPSFRPSAGRAAAGPAPAPSGAWLLGAVAGGSQRSVSPWRNSRATCLCFSSALRKRTDGVLQRESSRVRL